MSSRLRPSWKNPQLLCTLSLVFLCGAVAGALIFRIAAQPVSAKQVTASWTDGNKANTLNQLQRELRLTPEQKTEIETVLDDFAMYYQMLRAQMDEVMAQSKQRVEQVLDEEQRKKFNRIMSELKERPAY
jgi:Spy/CpxP family protein refolding chaperone